MAKAKLPTGMTKRGDVYYAAFRSQGRLIRRRLSTDLRVATTLLNELKARADRAAFGVIDNAASWDELKAAFVRFVRQTWRRPEQYEADLLRFEEYRRPRLVTDVTENYVLGFREWRLKQARFTHRGRGRTGELGTVSPRTVNREVGTLHAMLRKGVEWSLLGFDPLAKLKPLPHDAKRKERRSLTVEEVGRIFEAAPPHLLPLLRLAAVTGMRRGELVALRFDDVDFDRASLIVRAATAKNHKPREIPLDAEALAMLKQLRAEAPNRKPTATTKPGRLSKDRVFVTTANTPWTNASNLLRAFYAVCKRAGIEGADYGGDVDLHTLRVTTATLAIENGASPKAVQKLLGHSTIDMTMRVYAQATDQSTRAAVAALPYAKPATPTHAVPFEAPPAQACAKRTQGKKTRRKANP